MTTCDICISVDMEPDCLPYLSGWRGVREGGPLLLDLFEREKIPVTYFTTGDTAQQNPESVTAIVSAGHELGCHGMMHRDFTKLSEEEADWELSTSLEVLRRFDSVTSFRAPYLRFPSTFLTLLPKHGIRLDSSQAKYKRHTARNVRLDSLTRIPVSTTSSVLRLPAWVRDPILRSLRGPVVLFVHPWEFVDLTHERIRYDCRFRTGMPALTDLRDVITLFKSRGANFCRMRDLAATRPNIQ